MVAAGDMVAQGEVIVAEGEDMYDHELKQVLEKGIMMKIINEDDPMLGEVWPERKLGKKRRKKMQATAKATAMSSSATASASGAYEAKAVAKVVDGVPTAKAYVG